MKKRKAKLSAPLTNREITWAVVYLLFQMMALPSLIVAGFGLLNVTATDARVNFCYYLINFLGILLIFRNFLKKNLKNAGSRFGRLCAGAALGFLGYYCASLALSRVYGWIAPEFSNVNDAAIAAMSGENCLLVAVGTVLLVPTAEECLYRGLFFRGLYGKSRWAAYLLSAAAFCSIHVLGYLGSYDALTLLLCFLQYIPAGLCLAWSYEFSDTIFAPILIHTAINALGVLALR